METIRGLIVCCLTLCVVLTGGWWSAPHGGRSSPRAPRGGAGPGVGRVLAGVVGIASTVWAIVGAISGATLQT